MRNLVVLNKNAARRADQCAVAATVDLHGIAVTIGLLETPDTRFDAEAPHRASQVLVRVKAISCSYRDQSVILAAALGEIGDDATPIGTEFVAEVVAVGRDVVGLKRGDRVLPVAYFPDEPSEWKKPKFSSIGLPTQAAGRELCVFNEDQVLRVPNSMPDDVAASFTTCAQTAYAMVRKSGVVRGTRVLVTAPNSSTSLFVISALAGIGAEIYAVTTSNRHEGRLRELGVKDVAVVDPRQSSVGLPKVFPEPECVLDVYADLYFLHALGWLARGGVFVTCGVVDQYQRSLLGTRVSNVSFDLTDAFATMVAKNVRVIGSCLGVPSDLEAALRDFENRAFRTVVDSTFSGGQIGEYLKRSFTDAERFGKVVYRF